MRDASASDVSKLRQTIVYDFIKPYATLAGKGVIVLYLTALFQSFGHGMKRALACGCDRSRIMRPDLVPGAVFPDYQLPDHTSTLRRLSELQGDDPFILTLARGHYCPKEHQQHLELAAFYPKIAVAYTQIATISTDDHHTLQ